MKREHLRWRVGGGVKIIAVVGTGSGCGKTTVACRILRAILGLGAVKISPREGASRVEWGGGGPGKDTALFVESGAVPVARIIGPRTSVGTAWESIKGQFESRRGVVIEGASALSIPGDRLVIGILGESTGALRADKNRATVEKSDLIYDRSSHLADDILMEAVRKHLAEAPGS
jgi:hypothetical protein